MRTSFAIILLFLLVGVQIDAVGQTGDTGQVYYVNKREFAIPFDAASGNGNRRILEYRLFAKEKGGDWRQSGKAFPNQKRFAFSTNQDGLFSFAVQRVYEGVVLDPPTRDLQPYYRVVIDTSKPRIVTRAIVDNSNAPGMEWQVQDENLDLDSISVEYRWPDQADWLPYDPKARYRDRDSMILDLKPDQRVELRLRAKDKANNEAVSAGLWLPQPKGSGSDKPFNEPMREMMTDPSTNDAIGSSIPSRSSIIYVNSKSIKLDTEMVVGRSGLKRIDLYTKFGGKDWGKVDKSSGSPEKSPGIKAQKTDDRSYKVEIPYEATEEGLHGFIVVATNNADIGGIPPKKTDPPQIQVMVDTTPPSVKLTSCKPRSNGERGTLLDIAWTATDANLTPQPIALEYSINGNTDWKPIADRLENTSPNASAGQFTWPVNTDEYQFYVRIRVKDRANNVGEDMTPKPVIVDLTEPSVEIKDVIGDKRYER